MFQGAAAEQYTATGDIRTDSARITIRALVLTAAGAAATAVIKEGGSGGTERLAISCPVNDTRAVEIPMAIRAPHLTLSGAGAKLTAFL